MYNKVQIVPEGMTSTLLAAQSTNYSFRWATLHACHYRMLRYKYMCLTRDQEPEYILHPLLH